MPKRLSAAAAVMLLGSCGPSGPPQRMVDLVKEFVYTSLSFSPIQATNAGYHVHNGTVLDEVLDNYDETEMRRQREYYKDFRKRLERHKPEQLNPEDRADFDILGNQIQLVLTELDTIQNYKHNPTLYVELVGQALFTPFVLEYAPIEERYRHITLRLKRIPALLGAARQNLVDAPEIWTQVAVRENDGNHDLIVNTLTQNCPQSNKSEFDRAAREALRAIDDFTNWLTNDLSQRKSDWRLGTQKYEAKFGPALALGVTPQQVLADAEAELARTRQQMLEIARPLHAKMFPSARASDLNSIVRDTLSKIAERHSTKETYFKDAERDLQESREFVRTKGLMKLPARDNLKVIETPVFMRGIYAVGGFNPAPALQPQLGAFYWLTPFTGSMDSARVQSKLREYNYYGLKILTIHEAIPGHYLQFEYGNSVEPRERRVLRTVFGNNPYIEGWAVYATDLLAEHNYLEGDPLFQLTWLKQYLRAVANTILDIRLHTMGMTDEQAMDLMMNHTFQEKEEATAKLQRAKLSSTQLPTYFTGFRAWKGLREKVQKHRGNGFQLAAFHEEALRTGAVPMAALERILMSAK